MGKLPFFQLGLPVWAEAEREPVYDTLGFRCVFLSPGGEATLHVAGCSAYRIWLNGHFIAHGPARCAQGHFRVDQVQLSPKDGPNLLAIEVIGYGVNAFSHMKQRPFLLAEVVVNGAPIAWTEPDGHHFLATEVPGRVRRVQRMSYMRPMSEAYRLTVGWDRWRTDLTARFARVPLSRQPDAPLHRRRSAHPKYPIHLPSAQFQDFFVVGQLPDQVRRDRAHTLIGTELEGFAEAELAVSPWFDVQKLVYGEGTLAVTCHDFRVNRTGFIRLALTCRSASRVLLTFDEVLTNARVDPLRLNCLNAIDLEFEPGSYVFESFEPYTFRYLAVHLIAGDAIVSDVAMRAFSHPAPAASFSSPNWELNQIFGAAVETLCQNSVDLFMDCPSRERAGYPCDSFFTARAFHLLFGDLSVEEDFLENFALPARFEGIPSGMMPMCYPSDALGGTYIPQWPLWLILQVEDYRRRGGKPAIIESLRDKFLEFCAFMDRFTNSDGLLEALPGWNFIEWSEANRWVQGVHYPTNLLWASALEAMAELYSLPEWADRARSIRDTVVSQSFDGEFFCDHALRDEGTAELVRQPQRSEVGQYFAFFFGAATPTSHPKLWATLVSDFGPRRNRATTHPSVAEANAFIGNLLRLHLLPVERIVAELVDAFGMMAETTGTLWENKDARASCNHGFASYAAYLILGKIVEHGVESVPGDVLPWCEARWQVPTGMTTSGWRKGQPVWTDIALNS